MSSKIAFIKHRHMKHHQKFVHDYYYILNGEMMMLKKHNWNDNVKKYKMEKKNKEKLKAISDCEW